MATIINTPSAPANESNGMGFLIGAVLLIVVVFVLLYTFLPMLRGAAQNAAPQNQGSDNGGGTTIQVPDQIDVNLNQNPQQ